MNDHLVPVENPAPPLPLSPDFFTSSTIVALPLAIIAAVLSQEPRDFAEAKSLDSKPYKLVKILSLISNIL